MCARVLAETELIPLTKKPKRNVGVLTYLQVQKKMPSPQPRLLKNKRLLPPYDSSSFEKGHT